MLTLAGKRSNSIPTKTLFNSLCVSDARLHDLTGRQCHAYFINNTLQKSLHEHSTKLSWHFLQETIISSWWYVGNFGCGIPSLTGMVNHNILINIFHAYYLAKCFDLVIQASWFKQRCNIIYTAKEMPAIKNRVRIVDSDIITSFVRTWPMSRIIYKCLSSRSIDGQGAIIVIILSRDVFGTLMDYEDTRM